MMKSKYVHVLRVGCLRQAVVNLAMVSSDEVDDWDINLNIVGGVIYSWRSAYTMKRMIMMSADNWCYDAHCTQLVLNYLGSITS